MLFGFWISMDFPDISEFEVLTLIKAYGGRVRKHFRRRRLLIVDTDLSPEVIRHIIMRSATVREGFKIYEYKVNATYKEVVTQELESDIYASKKLGIKVLLDKPKEYLGWDTADVSREIARYVLKDYSGDVDLKSPDKRFVFIFVEDLVISALELVGKHSKGFRDRLPSKRPVFSPFSLHPKLARTMINLSGALEGETILDPFSGVGGISVEASLMGINSICIEIMYKWALGCWENARWADPVYVYTDVICGDSLHGMIRNVKYVVTDPPYGRITSIGGYTHSKSLIEHFLEYLSTIESLVRTVFMVPIDFKLDMDKYGLVEINRFEIPVHSGLTRVLRVVERE
jgi:tRNA (guanine10-N2)-dimethyltransferase